MSGGFAGVVLAAGRSSRMGRPKALLTLPSLGAEPVLFRLLRVMAEAGLEPRVAVVGPGLIDFEADRALSGAGVALVAGDPGAPMVDSLARAAAALPGTSAGMVVQPVDAPYTSAAMITALLAPPPAGQPRVLAHEGEPGHPVLVPRALFPAITARPQGGLRAILAHAGPEVVPWPDRRVLADLDTPEALALWEQVDA